MCGQEVYPRTRRVDILTFVHKPHMAEGLFCLFVFLKINIYLNTNSSCSTWNLWIFSCSMGSNAPGHWSTKS